jgi:hypothetical protein
MLRWCRIETTLVYIGALETVYWSTHLNNEHLFQDEFEDIGF